MVCLDCPVLALHLLASWPQRGQRMESKAHRHRQLDVERDGESG